ncbi:MAG: lipoyl(octanoyl) transferase LipB [Betaproteobacteria bacterium]|nr:lipoyl(octanoyl) transferase LipB [Betaproteobacteria bacterium]
MRLRQWGRVMFATTYQAMQAFTASRDTETPDEIWLCEHPAVFTQGLAGAPGHVLAAGNIPVVPTNRGGQVTFHGPGQVVAYALIDLRRAGYFIKEHVHRMEEAVLKTLQHYELTGHRVAGAPGIYVRPAAPHDHRLLSHQRSSGKAWAAPDFAGLAKIAALGVKVSRHCTYHGVALNVCMDLEPFERINPCGHAGLQTTDLSKMGVNTSWQTAADVLGQKLATYLTP